MVNIYHCELCDKLSATALPSPRKRVASDALHRWCVEALARSDTDPIAPGSAVIATSGGYCVTNMGHRAHQRKLEYSVPRSLGGIQYVKDL